MKNYHAYPTSEVVPVITAAEFADFTGVDASDPLLVPFATTATAAVIEFLQSELIDRERVVVYEDWPTAGTISGPSLSRSNAGLCADVDLPYARLSSPLALAVEVDGTASTDYRVLDQFPAALRFDALPSFGGNTAPDLKATYTAGYGLIADVPQQIKTGVTMVADYLYNHRGECSADDAVQKSGAAALLFPYKAQAILI